MRDRSRNSVTKFVFGVMLVIVAIWVVYNRQVVVDQIRLLTYTPTAEVKALADNNQLQQRGRDLFYVSDPQVQDRATFNASCASHEHTIVLGCYKAQQIFLYNIKDERFNGIKEVTAAHEMLHAAYERLSGSERQAVNDMLRPIVEGMTDQRVLKLITIYNQTEPGELYNEMHSILGTEYESLTPELEAYYQEYFKDRKVVMAYARQYQAVFTESEQKIAEYDRQLRDIKPLIDGNNASLKLTQAEIQAESAQLNQYRSRGQIEQYNQSVPAYNAKVGRFNALIEETRRLVDQYNEIVAEYNNQAAAQNDLYDNINSNYQKAKQN